MSFSFVFFLQSLSGNFYCFGKSQWPNEAQEKLKSNLGGVHHFTNTLRTLPSSTYMIFLHADILRLLKVFFGNQRESSLKSKGILTWEESGSHLSEFKFSKAYLNPLWEDRHRPKNWVPGTSEQGVAQWVTWFMANNCTSVSHSLTENDLYRWIGWKDKLLLYCTLDCWARKPGKSYRVPGASSCAPTSTR